MRDIVHQSAVDLAALRDRMELFEHQREDRDNVRTCGAMTLALAARTPAQKTQAVERIQSRLEGEKDRNVSGPDLSDTAEWPGLILCEKDLHKIMTAHGVTWTAEDLETDTPPYGYERIYRLTRKAELAAAA